MTRFLLATLGCKVNQYESQALREAWLAQGCVEAADPAGAEVVVVNSCAVTAGALADLRQLVARVRRANPAVRVVVTGCAAQAVRPEVEAIAGVDCIVPQEAKATLLAGLPLADLRPAAPRPARGPRAYPAFAVTASPRARAQVKVQDGCSHGCSYCIVPLARGGPASRAPEAVLAECRRLLAGGWQELVLSGINLRQYRAEKRNFWGLLRFLEEHLAPEWAGRARLRLSSLDPGQLGAEALDTLAASRLACPHLHLSLQAGSPAVLARMNRAHYGPQDVLDFLAGLRVAWPRFGLGADLLAGFPGEGAAEFEQTRALVAALPLTYAHVFPYSPRPGTLAAGLPGQLSPEVKKERAATLRQLAGRKKAAFLGELSGLAELGMVLEDAATGRGTSEYGNDCRLDPVPAKAAVRAILRVRPVGLAQSGLRVASAGAEARPRGGRTEAHAGTAQPRGGGTEARRP